VLGVHRRPIYLTTFAITFAPPSVTANGQLERREMMSVTADFVRVVLEREMSLWARFTANLEAAQAAMAEATLTPFVEDPRAKPASTPAGASRAAAMRLPFASTGN
jgi:hypothetical protein